MATIEKKKSGCVIMISGPGRSLYVGAALFELPLVLCESIVLGRAVDVHNLADPETAEINRALELVAQRVGVELPRIACSGLPQLPAAAFDHVWLVSVLTDPTTFPALHDELYDRHGTELATGACDLADDRERAATLLDTLVPLTAHGALFSTSDEELPLVEPAFAGAGRSLHVPDTGRLSGIVGDPVRLCRAT